VDDRELLDRRADPLGERPGLIEVRLPAQDGELLAAVAREHVLGADQLLDVLGELHQHLVAGEVAVGVVDLLEVIDVEQDQRQRGPVPRGERELDADAILEVLLVEDLRQPVAERGVVHLPLEVFFEAVVVRELEDRRLADLDLVTIVEQLAADAHAVDEGAVARPEVLDVGAAVVDHEATMAPRHPIFEEPHVGIEATPEHGRSLERDHLADLRAGDHDQVGAVLAELADGVCGDANDGRVIQIIVQRHEAPAYRNRGRRRELLGVSAHTQGAHWHTHR